MYIVLDAILCHVTNVLWLLTLMYVSLVPSHSTHEGERASGNFLILGVKPGPKYVITCSI